MGKTRDQSEVLAVEGWQRTSVQVTEEELQIEADAVKRKRDKEISTCFERARENLNGLLRSKKQVIRDLAHELERLGRPVVFFMNLANVKNCLRA